MANEILNTQRLLCPLPVIRLQQTIQTLNPGDTITLLATDPGVLYDVPTWCKIHGHSILNIIDLKPNIQIEIEVGANK